MYIHTNRFKDHRIDSGRLGGGRLDGGRLGGGRLDGGRLGVSFGVNYKTGKSGSDSSLLLRSLRSLYM